MSFDRLLRHTLVVKRTAPVVEIAETAGGANTTLTADTAVGATTIPIASAAVIADGNWMRVGATGNTEIRQVATGGVTGLVVSLTAPLALAHGTGDQVREVDDAGTPTLDDYRQPVTAAVTVDTVKGQIQPRTAREVALANQAGAVIGEHVGFLRPLAWLTTADWIEHDGIRYDIVSMSDAAGLGHHLELGLRRVG